MFVSYFNLFICCKKKQFLLEAKWQDGLEEVEIRDGFSFACFGTNDCLDCLGITKLTNYEHLWNQRMMFERKESKKMLNIANFIGNIGISKFDDAHEIQNYLRTSPAAFWKWLLFVSLGDIFTSFIWFSRAHQKLEVLKKEN
jgi:hypothetical protein